MHPAKYVFLVVALLPMLIACSGSSLPREAGYGPNPTLPPPDKQFIPRVKIAEAVGWQADQMPTVAEGLQVNAFASGLDHPRWLYVLPNGDVLVAESNAPQRPERKGLKIWAMNQAMARAGAATPSANRITLLRDTNGDGVAELKQPFLEHLNSPFGMALIGQDLYVANTDAVVRFPYAPGATRIDAPPTRVAELSAGPRNHHWTKNILPSKDGMRLYATVGSNSNVAEHGMHEEERRAAILEITLATGETRVFASGLRNPNGLDWNPDSGELWAAVNERDEIGDDLVPDYITSVRDGGFYGWPYSYFGQHVDERVKPARPDLVSRTIPPDYAVGAHAAALGFVFSKGGALPARFHNGAFIGQHGSWNRSEPSGYKVIFVPFAAGRPNGMPKDVLTGFLTADRKARGRPVGVTIDARGALLVADDVGNVVWRVSVTSPQGR